MIKTSDMYLAATLISYDANLIRVDKQDSRRQIFEFENIPTQIYIVDVGGIQAVVPKNLEEIKIFLLGEKLMFPPSFINAMKTVKSCLHD